MTTRPAPTPPSRRWSRTASPRSTPWRQAQHGGRYVSVGWEADRVAILKQIEKGKFFQTVRGGLVTGLYNNHDVWPKFGYEGASADKGGYIHRGFDDIDWI